MSGLRLDEMRKSVNSAAGQRQQGCAYRQLSPAKHLQSLDKIV
jgi:hypothetical protein